MDPGQPEEQVDFERIAQLLREALHAPEGTEGKPRLYVAGQDEEGLFIVVLQDGESTYQLKVPDLAVLSSIAGPKLKPRRTDPELALPFRPQSWNPPPVREHPVTGSAVSLIRAGADAQRMENIEAVRGQATQAALFTTRGPTREGQGMEYKAFNEDAAVVWLRPGDAVAGKPEIAGVGAFDQAGGEGSTENHGAASDAAARAFERNLEAIAAGGDPEQQLRKSVAQAGDAVRSLGVGAMTTFAAAVVVARPEGGSWKGTAHVAVVGDSRAILFAADGTMKEKTRLHNMGALVAAGEIPDAHPSMALRVANALSRSVGAEEENPDLYRWELAPGDRIAVFTDGLGDAHEFEQQPTGTWHADRCAEEQARVMKYPPNASEAVASLFGYALDQMVQGYGKPDNIGVAVVDFRRG